MALVKPQFEAGREVVGAEARRGSQRFTRPWSPRVTEKAAAAVSLPAPGIHAVAHNTGATGSREFFFCTLR